MSIIQILKDFFTSKKPVEQSSAASINHSVQRTNTAGISLIKSFEGKELKAYKDPVGIWTIGFGHTDAAGLPKVTPGLVISESQALEILKTDLRQYESAVARNVKVPLTANQFAALVSFTYNLGEGNLKSSTLLKKLNAGDYTGASKEFGKWNRAGGKILSGLTRRREAERQLFLS